MYIIPLPLSYLTATPKAISVPLGAVNNPLRRVGHYRSTVHMDYTTILSVCNAMPEVSMLLLWAVSNAPIIV